MPKPFETRLRLVAALPRLPSRPLGQEPAEASTVSFARAAGVLDRSTSDPSMVRALREPHIALDAYGRILGISKPLAEKLGFGPTKLIGRRLRHRVVGADRTRFQTMLVPLRIEKLPEPIAVRLRSKDETIVLTKLAPIAITKTRGDIVVVFRVAFELASSSADASQNESACSR